MSPVDQHATSEAPEPDRGQPSPYACPLCGELPRGCSCLRRSVRDRIADAIRFPADPEALPFLALVSAPALEPPAAADGRAA